jgi:hypothetical protein
MSLLRLKFSRLDGIYASLGCFKITRSLECDVQAAVNRFDDARIS